CDKNKTSAKNAGKTSINLKQTCNEYRIGSSQLKPHAIGVNKLYGSVWQFLIACNFYKSGIGIQLAFLPDPIIEFRKTDFVLFTKILRRQPALTVFIDQSVHLFLNAHI